MVAFLVLYTIGVILDLEPLRKVNSKKDITVYILFSILVITIAAIYFITQNNFDLVHDVFKIID